MTSGAAGINARDDIRVGLMAKKARNERPGIKRPRIPEAEHPALLRQPDSGREIL